VELLQDSAFDVAGLVARKLGMRIARKQAEHWVLGTGTGQPEGITNPAADEVLATTSTVTFQDLLDVMATVNPAYVGPEAKWYMNNATLFHIRAIQDTTNRPLWLPQQESGMTTLPGGVLLGHGVVIDQDMPNHNTLSAKAIVFGDLRQGYIIRRVKDVTVVVDPFTRASEGQVVYTAWARADGAIQQKAAYSILANAAV
ncbi:MAG: phage major capsid protein, partial [bacterium]